MGVRERSSREYGSNGEDATDNDRKNETLTGARRVAQSKEQGTGVRMIFGEARQTSDS
jgi:hypothetical protein